MDQQVEATSLENEGGSNGQEKGDGSIVTPCTGMVFSSEKEVYKFCKSYARQIGFDIWKKSTKNDDAGQQKYYSLVCHKSGHRKMNGEGTLNAKPSAKTTCGVKINVRVSDEGSFIISKVCLDHNHELGPKMRYRGYSEEKMRYYKLCSPFLKLAEIGAESQENYDFLLKWIDEVKGKLMNKFVSETIDVDNVSVELGSEAENGNQHGSSLSPLEEQAKGLAPNKRKQSMVKNVAEKNKRSKKEEATSAVTDVRGKTNQQVEAQSLDVEGVTDEQEMVEGSPCVGMIFSSEREVREFYKSYACRLGFGICKLSTKNDDVGQQRYYSLACHRGGNRRLKGRLPLKARPSRKTGCKAKINIRVSNEGSFIISKVCMDHNHELSPNMSCDEYGYEEDEMMECNNKRSKKKVVQEQQNEQSQDMQPLETAEKSPSVVVTDQRGETSTEITTSTPVAQPALHEKAPSVVTDHRGDISIEITTSTTAVQPAPDPPASARSTHNTPPTPPPQPDMQTMAAQITALQTQLSGFMQLMTSRLPLSQPLPMPVPLPQVWPTHHPNLPVVGRAATHPQSQLDVSRGNSLSGNVRPTSHFQPSPLYLNFETNKDWMPR